MDILTKIQKELKVPKTRKNTFGNYKYRSCEDIMEAIKPILEANDCTLTLSDEMVALGEGSPIVASISKNINKQIVDVNQVFGGQRFYVKATATLTCGEKQYTACGRAREAENKSGMDESQSTGTASSYARKYALNGLFLIDDTTDADEDAKKPEEKAKTQQKYGDNKKRMKELLTKAGKATKAEAEAFIKEFTGNVRDMENYTEEEAKEDLLLFYSKSINTKG